MVHPDAGIVPPRDEGINVRELDAADFVGVGLQEKLDPRLREPKARHRVRIPGKVRAVLVHDVADDNLELDHPAVEGLEALLPGTLHVRDRDLVELEELEHIAGGGV